MPLPGISEKGKEMSTTFGRKLSQGNVLYANSHENYLTFFMPWKCLLVLYIKWEKQVDNNITPFPKCWEDLGAGKSAHIQRVPPATYTCQWISISTKHIIKWRHGRLRRKHTIYTNYWSYIFILSFFCACNGFLKTKSINAHGFLRLNLKKRFFHESCLDFPLMSFHDLLSQDFLSYL